MESPQELFDETKTRLDLNIAKAEMLQKEIQEKQAELEKLMHPVMEDQGALKQFAKLPDVVTETVETVESK